jgi:hypothetical protein
MQQGTNKHRIKKNQKPFYLPTVHTYILAPQNVYQLARLTNQSLMPKLFNTATLT